MTDWLELDPLLVPSLVTASIDSLDQVKFRLTVIVKACSAPVFQLYIPVDSVVYVFILPYFEICFPILPHALLPLSLPTPLFCSAGGCRQRGVTSVTLLIVFTCRQWVSFFMLKTPADLLMLHRAYSAFLTVVSAWWTASSSVVVFVKVRDCM